MKSLFIIAALFSLALFAGTINARKEPELKTRNNVLVNNDESVSQEFKIKPSLWVFGDDDNLVGKERYDIWVFSDEEAEASNEKSKLKKNKSSFWVYGDDIKQEDKLLGNQV